MNIFMEIKTLSERVEALEKKAHEPREFIKCEDCKSQVKEKVNASNDSVDNKDVSNGSDTKASSSSTRGSSSGKLKKQAGRQAVGSSKKDTGKKVSAKEKSKTKSVRSRNK